VTPIYYSFARLIKIPLTGCGIISVFAEIIGIRELRVAWIASRFSGKSSCISNKYLRESPEEIPLSFRLLASLATCPREIDADFTTAIAYSS
jgi:hypothetical protein